MTSSCTPQLGQTIRWPMRTRPPMLSSASHSTHRADITLPFRKLNYYSCSNRVYIVLARNRHTDKGVPKILFPLLCLTASHVDILSAAGYNLCKSDRFQPPRLVHDSIHSV